MGELTQLGSINGYLAKPEGHGHGPWPTVIVIQEWWGLDGQTRSIADRIAGEGYLAFAPDLFHGELAKLGDNETASMLAQKYGPNASVELELLFDTLRSYPDCNGKIGSIGFCFGGLMSLGLGLDRPLNAICTFYGGGMQQLFPRMTALPCPVLALFGDADQSIPIGTVEEFRQLLDKIGVEHEVIVYPNSGHAFFRDSDISVYKPEAAEDAWEQVKRFFEKHLKLIHLEPANN